MPTADFFREDAKKDQIKKLFALCALAFFALKHRSWSTPGFSSVVKGLFLAKAQWRQENIHISFLCENKYFPVPLW